jgi:hypothetical protein
MSIKLLATVLVLLLSTCASTKSSDKVMTREIKFGSGGGFTGEVRTYTLTGDSRVLEKEKELKKIAVEKTLEIFKKADLLKGYTFNKPENVYSFIEITDDNQTNRIVWAPGSELVDDRVVELQKDLISLIK